MIDIKEPKIYFLGATWYLDPATEQRPYYEFPPQYGEKIAIDWSKRKVRFSAKFIALIDLGRREPAGHVGWEVWWVSFDAPRIELRDE